MSEVSKKLEGIIKSYIASNKSSKPEDWIGSNSAQNNIFLKKIRNKHFHFSAKPGMGYAPRMVWDKAAKAKRRTRYIYDA